MCVTKGGAKQAHQQSIVYCTSIFTKSSQKITATWRRAFVRLRDYIANRTYALIATGFPYTKVERGADFDWVMNAMQHMLADVRDIRRLGSAALDLCYVARGLMDGYYEIALKPWDAAAGVIIAQEAGAVITSIDGTAVDFSNTSVVAANPTLHQQIVQQLR